MCLPPSMERFEPLFIGLCPTKITEDCPLFPDTGQRFIESKLRFFGFRDFIEASVLPIVKLDNLEIQRAEYEVGAYFQDGKSPVIFHWRCGREPNPRSRPFEYFQPIIAELGKHFTVVVPHKNLSLRELAALYRAVGRYCGVNTGNWHLAQAVGCRCLVIDIEKSDTYDPALWRYNVPQTRYTCFDHQSIINSIPFLA